MALPDYERRVANLRARRFDGSLNESMISKNFSDTGLSKYTKYLAEIVSAIPEKSTVQTIEAARRVQKHLENGFTLPFSRAYRTQGSVLSNTHIKASDFDFLTIIDDYHYTPEDVPLADRYKGRPVDDIAELRKQVVKIMRDTYDIVDDSNEKCVSIFNQSLNRKVDIVPSFWYNTAQYDTSKDEYYRGVKFKAIQPAPDFPFAHIRQVNTKGVQTGDGSKMAIRLLKTVKADAEPEMKSLKSFHITSLVHAMENAPLTFSVPNELAIAQTVSKQLDKLITDETYRKSIVSPNGCERPFEDNGILPDIKRLKADLDNLIASVLEEKNSYKTFTFLNS